MNTEMMAVKVRYANGRTELEKEVLAVQPAIDSELRAMREGYAAQQGVVDDKVQRLEAANAEQIRETDGRIMRIERDLADLRFKQEAKRREVQGLATVTFGSYLRRVFVRALARQRRCRGRRRVSRPGPANRFQQHRSRARNRSRGGSRDARERDVVILFTSLRRLWPGLPSRPYRGIIRVRLIGLPFKEPGARKSRQPPFSFSAPPRYHAPATRRLRVHPLPRRVRQP